MLRCNAICDSDIAREAEIIAWHEQKLILFRRFTETIGIRFKRFHKQIKRAVRICYGIPIAGKGFEKNLAVFLIYR